MDNFRVFRMQIQRDQTAGLMRRAAQVVLGEDPGIAIMAGGGF